MAANNDILEMFEMVGTVAVDMAQAFKTMATLEGRAEEVTRSLQERFQTAFEAIDRLGASPDIDINSETAMNEIRTFRDQFDKMLEDLRANGSIDFDTDPAVQELRQLQEQARRFEESFNGPEGRIEVDAVIARQELAGIQQRALALRETLQDQRYDIRVDGSRAQTTIGQVLNVAQQLDTVLRSLKDRVIRIEKFISETVNRVVQTTYTDNGAPSTFGPQTTPSGQQSSNGPPDASGGTGADYTGAASAGMAALGASSYYASRGTGRFGYDLDRADRALQAYHKRMLQYAMQLDPKTALKRATVRLDVASDMFEYFPKSKNMLMLQATFSAIEQGALAARKQLSQLGFGRTKAEIKAIEGQMHTMANIRLDTLRDNIKLTEKALKDMKNSANADQFVEEMAEAERALKRYKDELAKASPVDVIAKANGYKAGKLWGKDVIYKPFDNAMDALAGRIKQFTNRDLAYLQNKTYEALDNAAKAIVGKQTTKAEEKAKIMQLATKYQMLGQQLNTFVTPAVLALAAAFGMVAANAQKGWGKFEAQTLSSTEDMKDFKNIMADTAADTGSSIEEVGELFSVLHNQMGRTKANIKESAEWGIQFKKAWGVDAVEAIAAVDSISKDLGVTQKEATDILALAMKKHQGDLKAATKDVEKNEKAWKKNGKTMTDGMTAYEKMVSGLDDNGISKSEKALRKMGNSLLELWKALEPTVIKLADAVSNAADKVTEFLRNNPGMATFLAHLVAIGGAGLVLLGVLAPIAGFMLMNRGLFQAFGQALGFAGKGMVVMSPAARMLYDNLMLTRNAVAGLPRMFRALGPGLLSVLRGLPGMVGGFLVQFVKMNPILSGIAAISWVIYKNWDRFKPVLANIWDSLKRIGNAVLEAFAGPGKTGAEGFNIVMDKLAKFLGDVLLPIFEVLAKVLEVVAQVMETGAGKYIVYAVGIGMMTGAIGKLIPGVGLLTSAFKLLTGGAGASAGAIGLLKKAFGGVGGAATKMGPLIGRALGGIGGVITRFGAMLLPLLANPWVLAGAAIVAAIVGIGFLIYKNWDKIAEGTKKIFRGISDWLSQNWKDLLLIATGPLGLLVKLFANHWDDIKSGAKKAGSAISQAFKNAISKLGNVFSGANLRKGFSRMWSDFKGAVGRNLRELNRTWSYQFGNLWRALGPLGDFLKTAFAGIFVGFPKIVARGMAATGRAITRGVRGFGKLITSGLKTATQAFKDGWAYAKKATSNAFDSIRKSVLNGIRAAGRSVSNGFRAIRKAFSDAGSFMRRVISGAFGAIRRTFTNAMNSLAKTTSNGLSRVRKFFSDIIGGIRRLVSNGLSAIRKTFSNVLNSIARTVSNVLGRIRRTFSNALSSIRKAVSNAFSAIRKSVSDWMSRTARTVSDYIGKIRRSIGNAMSYVSRVVRDAFRSVYSSIKDNLSRAWNTIKNTFGRIRDYFGGLARKAFSWGADIVSGVTNGITKKAKNALAAVKDLASGIAKTFKRILGIASPSKVLYALARWVPVAAENAINDGVGGVNEATENMANAAVTDFSKAKNAAKIDVTPEFNGDPAAIMSRMMAGSIGAGMNLDARVSAAAKVNVDKNDRTKVIQVANMPVTVQVQQLAKDQDLLKMAQDVQRVIVDQTNNEVNRMG
ncbi:hypothetical protein [Staphylococcus aureus]|uniref:hypothetical protein n=1 Tax=Staphylococcus aureus TaxID=1280 RepID=UPI0020BDBAF4|nr:hypothetical protein [Staphylococcus aureus]